MSAEAPPVLAVVLALLRAGPVGLLLPLPAVGRVFLAVLGAALLAPALVGPAGALGAAGGAALLPLVGRELLCGAALGLCAALPLYAAAIAGDLLDGVRGGRGAGARQLLLWLALALFATLGGFEALARALALSYEVVPLGGGPALSPGPLLLLPARLFLVGLLLGAHPVAALLLGELLCALALRPAALRADLRQPGAWAPPLRGVLGAAALLLGSVAISAALRGRLAALPAELAGALRSLGPG